MIKIYYSHTPFWRAEVLRVSLFIKDIPFEDIRVSREEFVHLIKTGFLPNGKRAPFHQLPVIEVDGKIIGQTGAIARYCGKASNLYSEDNLKAAKIDQIIDAATDITNLVSPTIREKDLDKKMTYLAEGMAYLAESVEHVSNTTVPLAKVAFAASLLVENVQDNLDEQTKDIVKQLKD